MLARTPMDPCDTPKPIALTVLPPAGEVRERADAARNRERILAAAEQLFAEHGVRDVSMDDIAACAKVGKGTLYRRFGDRGGLALALLDARDAEFQEAFVRGPTPLGPGAPPRERLLAFFTGLSDLLQEHGELVRDAERGDPGARFRSGPYGAYHLHVRLLLGRLDRRLDADVLAHMLLAPFAAELFAHLVGDPAGPGRDRLLAGVQTLLPADR